MNCKIKILKIISLSVLILFLSCKKEIIQGNLDAELERQFNQHNLPSLSACVFSEHGIEYTKYLGFANKENEIEVGDETIYHIGSISKLFIATAIMQLEENKQLELDEDISTYLPIDFRHPDFP